MLRINLAEAREKAGEVVQYHLITRMPPLEGPGESIAFAEPVGVDVRVTSMGSIFWVEGTVSSAVTLTCSRCLKQFSYPFQASFSEKYRLGATRVNVAEEDADMTLINGENLDLTDKVRESILLALPMKALCDAACRGLCPQCGRDLNEGKCACRGEATDPRLAVLAQLLENKEQEEVT